MTDESYSFNTARARLEEIVTQVRKKDTSLEKSLDLLEEGVRLANACTELIDRQDWAASAQASEDAAEAGQALDVADEAPTAAGETVAVADEESEIVDEAPDDPSSADG